ncbi:pro-FMRFamide-related neuropeptide VF [Centropristis striata]|uniref:pro-FMRFamide-related neuropeptide VF n=1 Tax=Centropristis striata TaxID=184440 RepID=UPI0027E00069|nr:pro-FMRFamide-related neuropeptide VF [Centropristis striata]
MLTTVFLSGLLMLGGLGGAAVSDSQVNGRSIHNDKTFLASDAGRHTVRKQPHQQTKSEIRRSLDLESFNIHVAPTTSRISLPTIIKLYPPTVKPPHLHVNMPLRFGRESIPDDDQTPNSNPNMPQRFGRSWELICMCSECPDIQEVQNPVLPHRFGRKSPFCSLLRILANAQLLNTGLHWAENVDITTGSEDGEIQERG